MGFISRRVVPRSVRRAANPVGSAKRVVRNAVVPKPVRDATYLAHELANPVSSAAYHLVEKPIVSELRGGAKGSGEPKTVYRHGDCPVKHRTPEAAQRCRNQ